MSDFSVFAEKVRQRFEEMSKHELFVTVLHADQIWDLYLASFPEGTNPIFRERTEHDCSCCKSFIRNIGGVVALIEGEVHSVWNLNDLPHPYNEVADKLAQFVETYPITGLYRTDQRQYGAAHTIEALADGDTKKWSHFVGYIADKHFSKESAKVGGEYNTTVQVFKRGLEELKPEAFTTVIDLIGAKNLYRGEEFLANLRGFQELQNIYLELPADEKATFIWRGAANPAVRFRNTAMGTLITDLSEGMPLEAAVKAFESKVAPTNYKRTTALITPRMIEDALKTLDELGLRDSLQRRHANLGDITINNVIWADNSAKALMKDGLADLLMDATVAPAPDIKNVTDISIDDFMANVVPKAQGIAALMKNSLVNNLVSLTAPVDPDAKLLFKWDNNFAWSYNGNITDSIKEKVKRAGGNTDAPLRISLAWFNGDDLDIHVRAPGVPSIICFHDKQGYLDVDMNAGSARNSTDPVENVSFKAPKDGVYQVAVNNYNRRSSDNVGFVIELENNGAIQQFSHRTAVGQSQTVRFEITVTNGVITDFKGSNDFVGGAIAQTKWGVSTEQFVKVNTLMFSPNHWDDMAFGNKHWFFVLDGCLNDEPTRGIYNEFLDSALDKHRKVFEVLGAKTMCPPIAEQLSGLGFSSTKGDSVVVQVTSGARRQNYNVQF